MKEISIYKTEEGHRRIVHQYEQYLNLLSFDFERVYVETTFGKTHVLVAGPVDGKPLFVLQGGNCINPMTLSWFAPLIRKYRVYAPDTLGHPGYSKQTRLSVSDDSFANWIIEIMEHFMIKKCAFVGPSYGAGIILKVAEYSPERIECSILASPAGISIGSKFKMIKDILLPMTMFKMTSAEKHLDKVTNRMSNNEMKQIDKQIIGDIFTHVKLERDMPSQVKKSQLTNYQSPTMVISGEEDVFFPAKQINKRAKEVLPDQTIIKTYKMGHFPSEKHLVEINREINIFLDKYYV
ncbi:alpha/beta fold hydrolase [Bacillus solimangrovi]|uniref:Alpha/beta hydrolase n=1 Tax=Bacillus solimangrovi TaxID=1305675 RepID=A0A1E5LI90_9BACI|nr:alpha/beta hydrolase [Bacillus solimangrovi]OEH93778.1 alpha/beta hydrolase [Bacillus solimangrovi]